MRNVIVTGLVLMVCACGSTGSEDGGAGGVATCSTMGGVGGSATTSGAAGTLTGAGGVGGHGNTMPAGGFGGGAEPVCLCDCPDGPPAPPAIDTFCADPANAGAKCCRAVNGSEVGTCINKECALQ